MIHRCIKTPCVVHSYVNYDTSIHQYIDASKHRLYVASNSCTLRYIHLRDVQYLYIYVVYSYGSTVQHPYTVVRKGTRTGLPVSIRRRSTVSWSDQPARRPDLVRPSPLPWSDLALVRPVNRCVCRCYSYKAPYTVSEKISLAVRNKAHPVSLCSYILRAFRRSLNHFRSLLLFHLRFRVLIAILLFRYYQFRYCCSRCYWPFPLSVDPDFRGCSHVLRTQLMNS